MHKTLGRYSDTCPATTSRTLGRYTDTWHILATTSTPIGGDHVTYPGGVGCGGVWSPMKFVSHTYFASCIATILCTSNTTKEMRKVSIYYNSVPPPHPPPPSTATRSLGDVQPVPRAEKRQTEGECAKS